MLPGALSEVAPSAREGHLRLLHGFGKSGDGEEPFGGLIQYDGSLYGTTLNGGGSDYGTIYRLSITGKETILHSFGGSDGGAPSGELLPMNGEFYGTTEGGGDNYYGVVYSVTKTGAVKVLHYFRNGVDDGANPMGGVIEVDGTLYGTTSVGGARGGGTVFAIDPSGSERVVYSFETNGTGPVSGLVYWKNKLWGTTQTGGAYREGTVFSLTLKGEETILHSFGNGYDGQYPESSLTLFKNRLYGTTEHGGTHQQGLVYETSPSGTVRTIYNFGDNAADGNFQISALTVSRNALYGVSYLGGAGDLGTIYRLGASGKETVLYTFTGGQLGGGPSSRLLPLGTNLYGTTANDGPNAGGTTFRFAP
jgi:uncharacterized repeat protein (TIGR03803 family)